MYGSDELDYSLFRNCLIRTYNIGQCGFETKPDIDHPLANYAQPESMAVGYDYWKEDTYNFFLEYPEAHKITGESLTSIREMTIEEYCELKKIVKNHYELKKQYPDTVERLLLEFREYSRLQVEGMKHAGIIRERKTRSS